MEEKKKIILYEQQGILQDYMILLFNYYELPLPGMPDSKFARTTFSRDVLWGAFVVEYCDRYGGGGGGGGGSVISVNGKTGKVVLTAADIPGLENIVQEVAGKVDISVFDGTSGWLVSSWTADLVNKDINILTINTDVTGNHMNNEVPLTLSVTGKLTVESKGTPQHKIFELGVDLSDFESGEFLNDELNKKFDKINVITDLDDAATGKVVDSMVVKELQQQVDALGQDTKDRGTVRNALTSEGNTYKVNSVTIFTGGKDYAVGDAVFIQSDEPSDLNAIYIVSAVDGTGPNGTGAVTGLTLSKSGDYGKAQTGIKQVAGGLGTGLTVTCTTSAEPASNLHSIVDPKAGDRAVVILDETHNYLKYQWAMMDYNGDGQANWVPLYNIDDFERNFSTSPIQTGEIGNYQVSTAKIGAGAVTPDKLDRAYMPLDGGTMTGPLDMGGKTIINVGAPVNDNDAATKKYVDDGLSKKANIADLKTVAFTGSYSDLTNKPGDATTSSSGFMSASDKSKLNGVTAGAEPNVQADWNETSSSSDAFIRNKPTISGAANDAKISIRRENDNSSTTEIGSFTTNQATAGNIYIDLATTATSGLIKAADQSKLNTVLQEWYGTQSEYAAIGTKSTSILYLCYE